MHGQQNIKEEEEEEAHVEQTGCPMKPLRNRPRFFDNKVNSCRYSSPPQDFTTQLAAAGIPMRTQWFMQDVERPLTAKGVLDFLHQTSGETVTSVWHSTTTVDTAGHLGHRIIPSEFLLWGFLKAK